MVITIDGPAGAGKSSVARALAERLGYCFLDTGAMYRAVTLAVMRAGIDFADADAIARVAFESDIRLEDAVVRLDDEDVTEVIRSPEVTRNIRHIADLPAVRQILNEKQRVFVVDQNCVTEGRDQGTEVFPHAACKIFLTASPEQRAMRRQRQLAQKGTTATLQELLAEQTTRDRQDEKRKMGRLTPASDAITVSTDDLTQEEVIAKLESIIRERIS